MITNCELAECPECGAEMYCNQNNCICYDNGYQDGYSDSEQECHDSEEEIRHGIYLDQKHKEAIELCFQRAEEYRKRNGSKT